MRLLMDLDVKRYRVNRGGSWSYSPSYAREVYRIRFTPVDRYSDLGFRLYQGIR
jgi:formylglycine-generating enzyme required for sulfatase activity